jgi:hypothetical protein
MRILAALPWMFILIGLVLRRFPEMTHVCSAEMTQAF